MTALLDLALRCEEAAGPDRELGREALRAAGWRETTRGYFMGPLISWSSPDGKRSFDDDDFHRNDPTASLDAAMSLVPEGWFVILDDLGADGMPLARLHTPEGMRSVVGIARNLTLALTAACLRAIAEQVMK